MNTQGGADVTSGVFGATGQTGRHVLQFASAQGHKVGAPVRDPSKLDIAGETLIVVQGRFENVAALRESVKDTTHVICCAAGTYGKGYDKGMMTQFVAQLWPILDTEPSHRIYLFQSDFLVPEPDGSDHSILKIFAPLAAIFTCSIEMLKDHSAVMKFMADNSKGSFNCILARLGKLVARKGSVALLASQKPGFAAISFADFGAFKGAALQDAPLSGMYPLWLRRRSLSPCDFGPNRTADRYCQ
jgi:hypothetical protein